MGAGLHPPFKLFPVCGRVLVWPASHTSPLYRKENPMDPRFQPGEIVDVTIRGLRIESIDEVGIAQCSLTAHAWRPTINLRAQGVKVERAIPADGEPQPGELWADQVETLYAVQSRPGGSARLVDVDAPESGEPWEVVHRSPQGPIYRVAQRPLIGGQS